MINDILLKTNKQLSQKYSGKRRLSQICKRDPFFSPALFSTEKAKSGTSGSLILISSINLFGRLLYYGHTVIIKPGDFKQPHSMP
ncbi:hypothetical protein [Candidatus Chlorobium masyuteum]|uniref:hypothetical protein n=1 Tax=Candidatus Chlorobium masyuteum TaxID=2716876 RepID=UPI001421B72C|nr:hypothetical protein [Candidatus Chlorobium masyuteum]